MFLWEGESTPVNHQEQHDTRKTFEFLEKTKYEPIDKINAQIQSLILSQNQYNIIIQPKIKV